MKRLVLFLACILIISSCSNNKDNTPVEIKDSVQPALALKIDSTLPTDIPLIKNDIKNEAIELPYINAITHSFSNELTQDTFKISLTGTSVLEGAITFEIMNSTGEKLFSENYSSQDFIIYFKTQTDDTLELTNYIIDALDSFLDEANFQNPAIPSYEKFNEMYSDESVWKDLKNNTKAIGFKYTISGSESKIVYSKKDKKVLRYFHSES